ncbi:hypothetical protein P6B95_00510 [Streptomyces atratus]|uniref:hypothetical protein n=1 Tax=Streptomyces atratus TaxID=1893 RepID=UPI002AC333A1|nr:hypothetical protein [Streptomyces atratus]WPW26107.1 hypothetical protein P6B95_00510 [Streptomyces atratus]
MGAVLGFAIKAFARTCGTKWPKAVAKHTDGAGESVAFYCFPAERWVRLRTTSAIESTFCAVRLPAEVTRGAGSPAAALAMVSKPAGSAQDRRRTITGAHLVPLLCAGTKLRERRPGRAIRGRCRMKHLFAALDAPTDHGPDRRDVAAAVLGAACVAPLSTRMPHPW